MLVSKIGIFIAVGLILCALPTICGCGSSGSGQITTPLVAIEDADYQFGIEEYRFPDGSPVTTIPPGDIPAIQAGTQFRLTVTPKADHVPASVTIKDVKDITFYRNGVLFQPDEVWPDPNVGYFYKVSDRDTRAKYTIAGTLEKDGKTYSVRRDFTIRE